MAEQGEIEQVLVLSVEAVRASIDVLQDPERRIHPFFPAYLHLRQQAALQGTLTSIRPAWSDLGELLDVPGGPYGRPYFRPFWDQRREGGQEWLNPNLAGSYSPSSIRAVPRKVIDVNDDGTFVLKESHWELARLHLAAGQQVPALALAGFFFRNDGFATNPATPPPTADDLVLEFRRTFGYTSAEDDEFNHLFTTDWPGTPPPWFEAWTGEPFEEAS